jgi:hypothetical protein
MAVLAEVKVLTTTLRKQALAELVSLDKVLLVVQVVGTIQQTAIVLAVAVVLAL